MGLRSDLLNVILQDLPTSASTIDRSSARFDQLMGGKLATGMWGRYQTNFGTSCAVTVTGWMLDAHAPPDMLNAPAPGGGGFVPGAHFTRLMDGAKRRGWWRTPSPGQTPDVRPGDIYMSQHGPNTEHMGVVVAVTPNADGSLTVETADGGQVSSAALSGPDIKRQFRTFTKGGGYKATYSSGNLIGWIAVGGDEPLVMPTPVTPAPDAPVPDAPAPDAPVDDGTGGAPSTDQGTDGSPATLPRATPVRRTPPPSDNTNVALAVAAAGVAMLLGAAAWYVWQAGDGQAGDGSRED